MEFVKATDIVKGYGNVFKGVRLSAAVAIAEGESELYERKSHPSVFGVAFNLMLDYRLYCDGYVEYYSPKGNFSDDRIKRIRGIVDNKETFTPKQIYALVRAEQIYRSGFAGPNKDDELEKLILDFPYLIESVEYSIKRLFKGKNNIVVNPIFGNLSIGVKADGDFILNNILYEIKCTKDTNCSTKTIRQLMIYKLLNESLKEEFEIERFGYYNPLRKQIVEFDIEIPKIVRDNWQIFKKRK